MVTIFHKNIPDIYLEPKFDGASMGITNDAIWVCITEWENYKSNDGNYSINEIRNKHFHNGKMKYINQLNKW